MNTFGRIFRLTSFGESHGNAIGGVIDGIPAGEVIDIEAIQSELNRRRPGQSSLVSQRNEQDRVELLSGIFEGKTLGTPIGFIIRNCDHHSGDYDMLKDAFRPSHADYTYTAKYGIRDHRGGGRASARETACRIVAGAIAKQILLRHGIRIDAYTSQIGSIRLLTSYSDLDLSLTESSPVRCPDSTISRQMTELIEQIRNVGDTIGGVVTCVIKNVPAGLGNPVFGKLQSRLADAMMSINAAKGFDYGVGFDCAAMRGSEMNDSFTYHNGEVHTATNHSGGIQGGISNGEDILMRIAFKPVATLMQNVETIDSKGDKIILPAKGRHDACVVPRAVPIVEAMAAMVILDNILLSKTDRL